MVRKAIVGFAAFMILAGQAAHAADPVPRALTEAEKQSVRASVVKKLRDPESARFRWNPELLDSGLYCGFVNGKNAYGGYAGFSLFMAILGTNKAGEQVAFFAAIDKGASAIGPSAEYTMCEKAGYNLRQDASPVVD